MENALFSSLQIPFDLDFENSFSLSPSFPLFYPDKWNKNNNNCSNKESTRANRVPLIQIGIKADIDLFVNKIHQIHHLNGCQRENRFVELNYSAAPTLMRTWWLHSYMKLGYKSQLETSQKQLKFGIVWNYCLWVKAFKIIKFSDLPCYLFTRNLSWNWWVHFPNHSILMFFNTFDWFA